jgi:hypothetical protein
MQNNAISIFEESERNQLGDINKWLKTYLLLCFVIDFI